MICAHVQCAVGVSMGCIHVHVGALNCALCVIFSNFLNSSTPGLDCCGLASQ